MSWTAPATTTAGQLMTAAFWNTHVRDNEIELRAGGIAIPSQAANEVIFASSATQFSRSASFTFDGTNAVVAGTISSATGFLMTANVAGGNGPRIFANSNTLAFTGGTSGYQFNSQNNGTNLLAISNAGVINLQASYFQASSGQGFRVDTNNGGAGLFTCTNAGQFDFYLANAATVGRWYPSGGLFLGTTPADPGANNFTARGNIVGANLTSSALTLGRVTFAGASGLLSDDADFTFVTDTLTVTKIAATTFTGNVSGTARINSFTGQPGFLAFNSSGDASQGDGTTVDFDTEVYDETGNFAADTFTAPVAGRYLFAGEVNVGNPSVATASVWITLVTSNRTYQCDMDRATTTNDQFGLSFCVIADMDASDTASIVLKLGSGTINVNGDGTLLQTFFSGRLLP